MTPDVTIVIPSWNGARFLRELMPSLAAQRDVTTETVIVDNGSEDDTAAVAEEFGARLVALPENRGLAAPCNLGAAPSFAPYLFFLNNDMRLEPNCVAALAAALAADDDLFATDARHWNWEGDRLTHGVTRLCPGPALSDLLPYLRAETEAPDNLRVPVPWGCAGALMVRRERFQALGGFDSRFFLDWEDVDLCWRAWRRGWGTLHVPEARLHHRVGASSGGVDYTRPRRELRRERPRLNKVRALSSHRNWGTWVAKTMPERLARYALTLALVRALRALVRGNATLARIIFQAHRDTMASWLRLRREAEDLDRVSVTDSEALIERFVREGAAYSSPP
jgi:GT2 family glycosyltransferase